MSTTYAEEVANDITRSNSVAKLVQWLRAKWAEHQRRQAVKSSSKSEVASLPCRAWPALPHLVPLHCLDCPALLAPPASLCMQHAPHPQTRTCTTCTSTWRPWRLPAATSAT
jgi:hypothetical protein